MFDSSAREPREQPKEPDRTLLDLGAAIREGRRQHGLTQMQLEALSGVDQTSISRLERGLAPGMKTSRLARILAVLPRSGLLGASTTIDRDIWLGLPTIIGSRELGSQPAIQARIAAAPLCTDQRAAPLCTDRHTGGRRQEISRAQARPIDR